MATGYLLRIVFNELEMDSGHHTLAHRVLRYLWAQHVAGVTMRKGMTGIDQHNKRHESILEDEPFNDLPLIIESVLPAKIYQTVVPGVNRIIANKGQISAASGQIGSEMMQTEGQHYVVKLFTKADNQWFRKDHYEDVLDLLQKHHVGWATVTRGIAGYGKDHEIHRPKVFSFSHNEPIVVEAIVAQVDLQPLLTAMAPLATDGVLFTTAVDLVNGGDVNG
ncbi:hypothetical protein AYR54_08540 [Loigolactobacillus backii]|uniref:DUF190 domain-containing protein n=1 Tax=Loigolactobacillus backii TaxID=375175 RepID=UPI0007F0E9F6|nr:DUF190 domain-containing protein [Loigolactobacillus backii]ANK60399.1 hypothetical protein AYR52_09135 [Loigolactobacillus backii]ANK65278.1 hypothetical protein AYR54_08540 [Loigolactobacillus backii]ANK67838.1 hypothetical protein AYR55_09145 [Loigolactobacillus backii]OLF70295.1 hypothetical protein ACX53_03530 [Loigolactobacillus backii]PIO86936.1 hypothetical protein B8A32_07175 [Loigolactobacillus backii]